MNIDREPKLDFDDVLLVPQRTKTASRKEVVLEREFKFYHSPRTWTGIPIVISNMDTTGSLAMAKEMSQFKVITALHKFYKIEDIVNHFNNGGSFDYTWLSLGMRDEDIEKVNQVAGKLNYQPNLVIDVANGYTDDFINHLAVIRKLFPESIIMAGNICTAEMVPEYILHGGVDIVKIGIGPGSVCTTRIKTGVGYPQLSAIDECAYKAHGLKSAEKHLGLICGDGGCKNSGDIAKAFAANSDFVMVGGMFAGTDECEGKWKTENDISQFCKISETRKWISEKSYKAYRDIRKEIFDPFTSISVHSYDKDNMRYDVTIYEYGTKTIPGTKISLAFHGMSSKEAMEQHHNGMLDYKAAEGKEVIIPYKGLAKDVLADICGGLRSCCSYLGAKNLKEISRCAQFVRVNRTHNKVFGE